jgi:hypothetical protein|tara:strand:+ start:1247 stop:1753 length:507 start_codon:yes stop_codon:yes gene_type:complete
MSSKVSNSRRRYSNATGRCAEVRFVRAARNKGLTVTKSSHTEDRHDHIDYWLALSGDKKWGVDVKGNNLPDEIWCEFKNVQGNPGWMYGGATIIAFDMPEEGGFAIVDREELAFFCEKHVSNETVTDKRYAYLKKYTRKDREDVITILKLHDLKNLLSYRVWEYDKRY